MINTSLTQTAEEFRSSIKSQNEDVRFDLVVVGGGITGAGILREASRRGLKVLLLEQNDFAWGTSSRSSKMVHGGLRYLGEGKIGLTRESVRERQRYLSETPGLVDVMRYLMVHKSKKFPPRWLFQILLAVYDFFAGKRYRQSVSATNLPNWLGPISPGDATGGSVFADAVTDDSRLVLRALMEAADDGGTALNYAAVQKLVKDKSGRVVGVEVNDTVLGQSYRVYSDAVINATGAWAGQLSEEHAPEVRPLRGSHLVLPFWKLPVSCSISMLHPKDGRPVFVFPWQGTAVIGTTDLDHIQSLDEEASITQEEVDYLLEGANYYLKGSEIRQDDIVSTWAGVRPVISSGKGLDPSKENREHSIWEQPGLITVAGGKLTTFRLIAFDVLSKLAKSNTIAKVQDSGQPFFTATKHAANSIGSLSGRLKRRLSGKYGRSTNNLLTFNEHCSEGYEETIGFSDVSWLELEWAVANESVHHLDDLMLRRTRLGNVMPHLNTTYWERIRRLFETHKNWNQDTWDQEFKRYQSIWSRHYSVPSTDLDVEVQHLQFKITEQEVSS